MARAKRLENKIATPVLRGTVGKTNLFYGFREQRSYRRSRVPANAAIFGARDSNEIRYRIFIRLITGRLPNNTLLRRIRKAACLRWKGVTWTIDSPSTIFFFFCRHYFLLIYKIVSYVR